jgi:hypothetical protein
VINTQPLVIHVEQPPVINAHLPESVIDVEPEVMEVAPPLTLFI